MKKRILSGMRPTGKLHLGHYLGALTNYVKLQDNYDCYFMIADLHVLTTKYEETETIIENRRNFVLDWLASGIDPEKSVIFVQSQVWPHSYLYLILGMIIPVSWLERNPTLKEMIRDYDLKDNVNYGLLGYPVLQAADILLYKGEFVPVGKDQLPHLEITREIARSFNFLYNKKVFPEPEALLTEFPALIGLNGKRMAKSLNNHIILSDSEKETEKRIMKAFTDPKKIRATDLGHPEDGCVIYEYHKIFNRSEREEIKIKCVGGKIGCVQCKKRVAEVINKFLEELRAKRKELEAKPELVDEILNEGKNRALKVACKTIEEVKGAIKI